MYKYETFMVAIAIVKSPSHVSEGLFHSEPDIFMLAGLRSESLLRYFPPFPQSS